MNPWIRLATTPIPGSTGQMHLFQRAEEYSIRVERHELMNSRVYASEDALSELGCARIRERPKARVLIGGLGMGYSLRTALACVGPDAEVVVAELVPALVTWNRDVFGHLADHPLRDSRVTVREEDVSKVIADGRRSYDAILLDVDNGPEGLTRKSNDKIYARNGLQSARAALRKGGVFGVWSSSPDRAFVKRLQQAEFEVDEIMVRARGERGGARHTIWLSTPRLRPAAPPPETAV
jgi:spermidine synthase